MFYILAEIAIGFLLVLAGFTQVILPAWNGTPFFPFFRRREIIHTLKEVQEEIEDEHLKTEIELARLRAQAIREQREKHQQKQETV